MSDQVEQLLYLSGCVLAFIFAMHFPVGQRREGCLCALALLANWVFCQWTYTQPAVDLAAVYGLKSYHLWPLADVLFGGAALVIGYQRVWGWVLFYSAMLHLSIHVGFSSPEVLAIKENAETYLYCLDQVLKAQIFVFLYIGGRRVRDRIMDCADAVRIRLWSVQTLTTSERAGR
jgi:hypothetical protein